MQFAGDKGNCCACVVFVTNFIKDSRAQVIGQEESGLIYLMNVLVLFLLL